MTWISTHGKPTQRAPRSVGMLEHLGSTHPGSMSILSTASLLAVEALLPLCVLKQGLKKQKTKVLRGIGFSSKSWGLTEIILWTGLKAFLHDIIPGKLHRWPLTKCSSCAHAGGSVELHSVCTFELEKLHNDLFSSAFAQSYTCLIMLVTVTQTWEIILFHFVSYHIISYSHLIRSFYICKCLCLLVTVNGQNWRVTSGQVACFPSNEAAQVSKKVDQRTQKQDGTQHTFFFLYKSCTFSPQVTVWCSFFLLAIRIVLVLLLLLLLLPLHHPPSHHSHLYQLLTVTSITFISIITLLSINLSPFTWSPSVDCLGAGTPRQRWALLCAESGAQGLCKTFLYVKASLCKYFCV